MTRHKTTWHFEEQWSEVFLSSRKMTLKNEFFALENLQSLFEIKEIK